MKVLKFLGIATLAVIVLAAVLLYQGDIPKDVVDARYSNADSQFADFGEMGRIHFRDEGNRRNFPVILLHGANASLHTFEPWVKRLKQDYRVITIDLPGHGLTGAVPSGDYSTDAMLGVVHDIADHIGVDKFVIGGNSMGGGFAWRYALAHPDQIAGLVLINATGTRPSKTDSSNKQSSSVLGFQLLRQPWFRSFAMNLDPYYLIVQGLNASHYRSEVVDEAMIMRYYDLILREGTRKAILDRYQSRTNTDEPNIADITAPTLIMWGMQDSVIPFAYAAGFESALPHASRAYYEDVGHIPMEENSAESVADLLVFLNALTPDADASPVPAMSDADTPDAES